MFLPAVSLSEKQRPNVFEKNNFFIYLKIIFIYFQIILIFYVKNKF
jgi:hypothetical protein